ncbi:MAG: NAD-dependent epimerase/dehydratase family protein [Flavobacterium sp.]|nr:NAD-dependent epimerase/dehydratase family protein [Flavobacterium sp.]
MKIFITGASGFIGKHLATYLAEKGNDVRVLLRASANQTGLNIPNCTIFYGDVLDVESIRNAMEDCELVYHLAAFAKVWDKDPAKPYNINYIGTKNVLDIAVETKARKVLVTSTAGVFPPAVEALVNETTPRMLHLHTEYERTKHLSEQLALSYQSKGLEVVLANPCKVFGPGPIDDSNSSTLMIRNYINGKWKIIPGNGNAPANYVYVEDVVKAMEILMNEAKSGEQYIIGANNATFNEFFGSISKLSGVNKKLFNLPVWIIKLVAEIELAKAKLFGIKPLITPEWVRKIPYSWAKDTQKIRTFANYQPKTLEEGIQLTIDWLKAEKEI